MATDDKRMPEGTDSIIEGASTSDAGAASTRGTGMGAGTGTSGGMSTGGGMGTSAGMGSATGSGFGDPGSGTSAGGIRIGDEDALPSDRLVQTAADRYDAGSTNTSGASGAADTARRARDDVSAKAANLRDQATDKVRDYAVQGKDRAAEGLENVNRLIGDAADTVDAKIGQQYGDYVRQAGSYVENVANSLREKNVDELLADAREVVRKSPAVAIGAAAAIGFALARVVKAGLDPAATSSDTTARRDVTLYGDDDALASNDQPVA